MSLVHQGYSVFRSRLRRPEISSLRRELLSARSELLLQASIWPSPHIAREQSEDVLDLAHVSQQWDSEDLIVEQVSAKLRRVERVLDRMRGASYGICRECRNDISLSRLRLRPQAVLCTGCIEEHLEGLSADAL